MILGKSVLPDPSFHICIRGGWELTSYSSVSLSAPETPGKYKSYAHYYLLPHTY
jgi:hypothetical protein